MTMTGGEGRAASRNTLAASSRLSTSLCWADAEVVVTRIGEAVEDVTSVDTSRSEVVGNVED